jgi:glycosyltransferase involved in cell wall biosynthesis
MQPTYTVIVATHERPDLLRRALGSLLAQTYPCHQIVVVSDSTDTNTHAVVSETLRFGDVFIQRTGAPGPAKSRNIALSVATGDYVLFLDDDDAFRPQFLLSLTDGLRGRPGETVFYTNFEVVDQAVSQEGRFADLSPIPPRQLWIKNFIPNNCIVYPRSLISQITFDEAIAYEDWDFILSAAAKATLSHIPVLGPVVYKNSTPAQVHRGIENQKNLLDCYIKIYNKHASSDPQVAEGRRALFETIGIKIDDHVKGPAPLSASIMPLCPNDQLQRDGGSTTPSPVAVGRDRLPQLDGFAAGLVFTFWLGPYVMSPTRTEAVLSILRDTGRPVVFITDSTLRNYELPDSPFHPAFSYLSEVHKADYLRCYLMHHYGGGYTDVKPVLRPWDAHFLTLENSGALALGYPEISPKAVAQLPGAIGEQLRQHYQDVIGYCSMVFRRQTRLTTEWMQATDTKLDGLLAALKANPARHPMDQLGVRLPDGTISTYPLQWTELGGNIFHPIILKYKDDVLKTPDITPQLVNYR